jgi:hypothetical protein
MGKFNKRVLRTYRGHIWRRGAPKEQVHHMGGPVEEQHGSERTYSDRLIPVSRDIFAIRVLNLRAVGAEITADNR